MIVSSSIQFSASPAFAAEVPLQRPQAVQQLQQLLSAKPSISRDAEAYQLARWAISAQQSDIFEKLVPKLVPMDSIDAQGNTLPMWMAVYNRPQWISRWSKARLLQRNQQQHTALSLAIEQGHFSVVRALLQAGAGEPRLLSYAALLGRSTLIPEFFRFGMSPLSAPLLYEAALSSGQREVCRVLARYGVDFRYRSELVQTNIERLRPFLKSLAQANARELTDWLIAWDPAWVVDIADGLAVAESTPLLERQKELEQQLRSQLTPPTYFTGLPSLSLAFRPGSVIGNVPPMIQVVSLDQVSMLDALLEQEVSVEASDIEGNTPLLIAAEAGHVASVKWLLQKGARVNAYNRRLKTPLMMAALGGHIEVVKLLLAAGADSQLRSYTGEQAIDYAQQYQEKFADGQELLLLLSQNSP